MEELSEEVEEALGSSDEEEVEIELFGAQQKRKRKKRKRLTREERIARQHKPKKRKTASTQSKLPPDVAQLMGEANSHYISREFPEALKLLHEVVRRVPNVADPYHTLGLIYEEMDDKKKSLEFYLIAAHLTPKDSTLWKRLGQMSREQGMLKQAIYCYKRCLGNSSGDADAMWDRAFCLAELGENKKAVEGFEQLFELRPYDGLVARETAKLYHKLGQSQHAIKILERCLQEQKDQTDYHSANMLCELYMELGSFEKCVQLVQKLGGSSVAALPIDLTIKLGICLAYLNHIDKAEQCFDLLLNCDVQSYSDLYLDVAETLQAVELPDKALHVYNLITQVPTLNNAQIWKKQAVCCAKLKDVQTAISLYEKVLTELPKDVSTRVALSDLYRQVHDLSKAVLILQGTDLSESTLAAEAAGAASSSSNADETVETATDDVTTRDPQLVYQEALLHHSKGDIVQFCDVLLPFLLHAIKMDVLFLQKKEKAMEFESQTNQKAEQEEEEAAADTLFDLRPVRKERNQPAVEAVEETVMKRRRRRRKKVDLEEVANERPNTLLKLLGEEKFFDLAMQVCKHLAELERYSEASTLIHDVVKSDLFNDSTKMKQMKFMAVAIAFNSEDYVAAYESVRYVCTEKPYSVPVWNLFNKILTRTGAYSGNKSFLTRLLQKHPSSIPLMLLVSHLSSMSGSYNAAISEYFKALHQSPNDPMIHLCIGVSYLNLAMSRVTADRHYCVIRALTFFDRYYDLRGPENENECAFNLARACQQLGLHHVAVPLYERVLRLETTRREHRAINGDVGDPHEMHDSDLTRETAYNLSHIYRLTGNNILARQVLQDFIVV